ncbi:hypothetical protein A3A71_03790 [Candidatus Berkelbacteria bacterium RIFCSPLOWO2_01_FULL_50_28]|uniref:Uncharacterized protein n=1 Tax=Candidatus Berkelbacteria bacterium RIFCSPLOWO2_01_FULL_50_28 TaxID=1797471 RepID=A0A1F5EAD5_9BACT|nr:MAG: hypothetical protein A3F39_01155 [Candidatus Berkelbacteria bacterium RIFCSPHIGHO2_12_FULL_50_11]OGD64270.1 MAG: hypothetical protein A3A71_03790 [Candidatus Berkelbacteria bacterium RIFCSPLOWO2_01_FULL_50_28]
MQAVPSWDLFLTIFFIVSIGYSFVLQRDKVVVTLLAIYAGIVVATVIGPSAQDFFQGNKTVGDQLFVKANASPFSVSAGLFILTTIVVSVRSGLGRGGSSSSSKLSAFELALFSFLNSALILTAIFSFMDKEAATQFAAHSRIARIFIDRELWWTIAPIIALVATGGLGKSRSSDY